MADQFKSKNSKVLSTSIKVWPFFSKFRNSGNNSKREPNSFLYVSSSAAHKNQYILLESFTRFFDQCGAGSLHLTFEDGDDEITKKVYELKAKGYPIFNHGFLSRDALARLYGKSEFVVYPSLSESFGLGLIEGINMGCKVLAADLPYTYAVCEPSAVFDPYSSVSISKVMIQAARNGVPNPKALVRDNIDSLIAFLNGDP